MLTSIGRRPIIGKEYPCYSRIMDNQVEIKVFTEEDNVYLIPLDRFYLDQGPLHYIIHANNNLLNKVQDAICYEIENFHNVESVSMNNWDYLMLCANVSSKEKSDVIKLLTFENTIIPVKINMSNHLPLGKVIVNCEPTSMNLVRRR